MYIFLILLPKAKNGTRLSPESDSRTEGSVRFRSGSFMTYHVALHKRKFQNQQIYNMCKK